MGKFYFSKCFFVLMTIVTIFTPNVIKAEYNWPLYDFTREDWVTEQPSGTVKTFEREGQNLVAYLGGTEEATQQGYQMKIVFDEDGETVWFYNIISTAQNCFSWVKGEIKGDKIIIPEGSLMWYGDYGSYNLYYILTNLEYVEADDDYESYQCIPGDIEFQFEDGIITLLPNSSGIAAIGLQRFANDDFYFEYGYNYKWLGYGDLNSTYIPFEQQPNVGPSDDAQICQYSFTYSTLPEEMPTGHIVDVVFEEDKIWIKGIDDKTASDAWVYAEISGDNAIFPSSQYLGSYSIGYSDCLIYLCSAELFEDENGYGIKMTDKTILHIDSQNGNLVSDGTLILNRGNKEPIFSNIFTNLSFSPYRDVASIPAKPQIGMDYYFDNEWQMGMVSVNIPCVDVEGNFIDPSYLSFRILVNGSPFTFDPSVYFGLFEPMTEIPYDFTDYYDIYMVSPGHWEIQLYGIEPESIGVQSISRAGGEINESEIATFMTSGIHGEIIVPEVVETQYFNLNGNEVSKDYNGIVIRKETLKDGRIKTTKILNRK